MKFAMRKGSPAIPLQLAANGWQCVFDGRSRSARAARPTWMLSKPKRGYSTSKPTQLGDWHTLASSKLADGQYPRRSVMLSFYKIHLRVTAQLVISALLFAQPGMAVTR